MPEHSSRRDFLKSAGFALAAEMLSTSETKADVEISRFSLPKSLEDLAKTQKYKDLLSSEPFKSLDSNERLTQAFGEVRSQNIAFDSLFCITYKYIEFLNAEGDLKMLKERKADKRVVSDVRRQAGWLVYRLTTQYTARVKSSSAKETGAMRVFAEGYELASHLYQSAIAIEPKHVDKYGLSSSFKEMIEISNDSRKYAQEGLVSELEDDKYFSAVVRKTSVGNIKNISKLDNSVFGVYIGEGRFVFPQVERLIESLARFNSDNLGRGSGRQLTEGWRNANAGGMMADTKGLMSYINKIPPRNRTEDIARLIQLLTQSQLIQRVGLTEQYQSKVGTPWMILFTNPEAFGHESQHHELNMSKRLRDYWIGVWNKLSIEKRKEFLGKFGYQRLRQDEQLSLMDNLDANEMETVYLKRARGEQTTRLEDLRFGLCLQEFSAYSSDNEQEKIFDEKHEIR